MMLRGRIHETVEKNRQAYVGFLMELIDTETTDEKEDQGQAVLRRRLERLPCRLDYFSPDPARLRFKMAGEPEWQACACDQTQPESEADDAQKNNNRDGSNQVTDVMENDSATTTSESESTSEPAA